jgi:hypothetical protein
VARKERERRAGLGKESPVIGERELETHRGSSPSSSESEEEEPPAPAPAPDRPSLTEREIRELRSKWNRIWNEQMNEARRNLAKARDDVYQCRAAGSFFFVPLAVDCNGVHERLTEAEARLKEVQANRYNWELLAPR